MQIFSQQSAGEVTYEIKTIDFELSKSTVHDDFLNSIIQSAKEQKFNLVFTPSSSKFSPENTMSTGNEDEERIKKLASLRFTIDYIYYSDRATSREFFKKDDGTVIERKLQELEWQITGESKFISDYECYKAILKQKYVARNGEEKISLITAWFCPSLPFPYGPKEFGGLPGLILELTEKSTTYLATKIIMSKTSNVFIILPSGKTITEEQYSRQILSN